MGAEGHSRSRPLLTFRLDRELLQRLKTRLAGEGHTMSEVVILGLQLYVQRSAWLSGPGASGAEPDTESRVAPGTESGLDSAAGPDIDANVVQDRSAAQPSAGPVDMQLAAAGRAAGELSAGMVSAGAVSAGAVSAGLLAGGEPVSDEPVSGEMALADATPGELIRTDFPVAGRARGDLEAAERTTGPATTVVARAGDLVLPDQVAAYLRSLRKSGNSDLLSAALAKLHDVGWPLRPLADALGISRQAVQARIRQQVADTVRASVPDVPPPSAFPRRRPALASGRRPHLTVKVDHALRSAAHRKAVGEGNSLSQVIEKILDYYLRHGMPSGEIQLGDTTPTRPAPRRNRRTRAAAPAAPAAAAAPVASAPAAKSNPSA